MEQEEKKELRGGSEEEEEEGWECEEDLEEPQQLLGRSGDERRLRGPGSSFRVTRLHLPEC